MTDLAGLIERLEGATGKDPELDADLRWALDRQRAERAYWNGALGMPRALPEHAKLAGLGRISVISAFPSLTASLDAAVAFKERVLPGWFWRCGVGSSAHHIGLRPVYGWAHLNRVHPDVSEPKDEAHGNGETAPIALLIATLRALQASTGDERWPPSEKAPSNA